MRREDARDVEVVVGSGEMVVSVCVRSGVVDGMPKLDPELNFPHSSVDCLAKEWLVKLKTTDKNSIGPVSVTP